jgi:hypothetical protein
MELKLNTDDVKQYASAAILTQLGEEGQKAILDQAVRAILESPPDRYGRASTSPLQDAFDAAVRSAAFTVAREVVAERPEFRDAIKTEIARAVDQVLVGDDYRAERFRLVVQESLLDAMAAVGREGS